MTTYNTKKEAQTAAKGRGCKLVDTVFFKDDKRGWLWREKEEDLTPATPVKKAAKPKKTPAAKKKAAKKAKEAPQLETNAAEAPKVKRVYENHSSVGSPVSVVHSICEEMGMNAKRKDVLAACEKAGVTYYTARTQIQVWRKGMKDDAAAKELADA